MSACRSCQSPVVWVENATTGKRMPLDPEPVAGGNVEIVEDGLVLVVTPDPAVARHVSHFATCRDADKWRRR